MGKEIERKFLVDEDLWQKSKPNSGVSIIQGYILKSIEKTVRIRITDEKAWLTIKGATKGVSRSEYEYEIPTLDAKAMLEEFCSTYISKTRYELYLNEFVWEIDEFKSPNEGLILAEIELTHENEEFPKPNWLGMEVSDDPAYFNANMI